MTALFMLFADAAMASTLPPSQAGNEDQDIVIVGPASTPGSSWSPKVGDWYDDTPTCPYAYEEEIAGFGKLRIGGRCAERDDKLADRWRD